MRKITDRFYQQEDKSLLDLMRGVIMMPLEERFDCMYSKSIVRCNVNRIVSKDKPISIEAVLLRIDKDKLCFTNFFSFFVHPVINKSILSEGSRYILDVVRIDKKAIKIIDMKMIVK